MNISPTYDLAVVGAGIVGLAHAYDAVTRGLTVVVLDRDERAVGASIRNFGHICTTAQTGRALELALVARERWLQLGRKAGFDVRECGTLVLARADDERAVLEELAASRGADHVRFLDRDEASDLPIGGRDVVAAAHLPLDLRVDPRTAPAAIARWLADEGVDFRWRSSVASIEASGTSGSATVRTSRGRVTARRVVVATGHDIDRLYPDLADARAVTRCRLQMLEVAPPGGVRIQPAVLTGLSMLRYGAMASTAAADAVRQRFATDQPELLDVEMNLMLTQRPDGAIVLGDTHHYATTPLPFNEEQDAQLLLREGARLFGTDLTVLRRWSGVYASSPQTDFLIEAPEPAVRLVAVTSGIGMTTALGLAPTVLSDLF
ncbi:TIGR03364 family FAD-dependent oxidoreductase [Aeromicrobium chenweiae]|uniref:TIGR03364 family FAD-dependent oxidoreductase n=1 Tax=Aeromicrobium chenweiae TaxID=2079793 RepID=UPI001F2742EC|nr:TIGR03364 family FAD-dependent oxidoreductase [Aeromicrobium chenweiae]